MWIKEDGKHKDYKEKELQIWPDLTMVFIFFWKTFKLHLRLVVQNPVTTVCK